MAKILFECILLSLILLSQSYADVVTVEGQAVINKSMPLLAKQQALQDAIRQASMQSSVNLHSQTTV
ncbi:MAG: flagellar assembly protein T N-terminal domain-containing protein, partial [Methylobacter sp.]